MCSQKPWKNPPTRAEIRVIEELYAIGEGAPAIRQQVLNVRLTLDVADQLEDMGIYNASTMTQEDTRRLTELATEQLEATVSSALPVVVTPLFIVQWSCVRCHAK